MKNTVEPDDLKKVGLRTTLPRIRILQILEENAQPHMTAENVYKALLEAGEDIGIGTVYRVLTQFESAGLINRHYFEGAQSVFELDQGIHHDHLLCVKCGRIEEFMDDTIEERQRLIAEQFGFTMTDHSLHIYGVCEACERSVASHLLSRASRAEGE
uniref:Ferric uptake regulation protein n=1 Tax=Candidatus Kentrum eta TaxID=2126337 RepID=A0A450U5H8_9GAMM|nr:MAG: Fur family transcriptional regulator, ferric uptake regulator [Candidatus Kentron sp. H]VFJ88303.1 MAG: Fur family transcriptional regulator, ferric uptake regulator [Candidatus Kentron sp. H]VFJ95522.1 MAG: Fur family transcriptional regulator, ferric uptake regulator [Candidatus Kentron sp. H]